MRQAITMTCVLMMCCGGPAVDPDHGGDRVAPTNDGTTEPVEQPDAPAENGSVKPILTEDECCECHLDCQTPLDQCLDKAEKSLQACNLPCYQSGEGAFTQDECSEACFQTYFPLEDACVLEFTDCGNACDERCGIEVCGEPTSIPGEVDDPICCDCLIKCWHSEEECMLTADFKTTYCDKNCQKVPDDDHFDCIDGCDEVYYSLQQACSDNLMKCEESCMGLCAQSGCSAYGY